MRGGKQYHMKGKNVITINGRLYDAVTGMPVTQQAQTTRPIASAPESYTQKSDTSHRTFSDIAPIKKPVLSEAHSTLRSEEQQQKTNHQAPSNAVHQQPQRSQTLHRAALKRPAIGRPTQPIHHKSPVISRFGPDFTATTIEPSIPTHTESTKPAAHPLVTKMLRKNDTSTQPTGAPTRSSKELKELLIKERLAEVETAEQKQKKERPHLFQRRPKLTTVLTSSLAILLLGGYLTFINLPNISMRVAATRAGITANFPSYKPDGYSFQGPITYAPGEVSINFKSNTNTNGFTLKQKSSHWDSQAVLDNYVNKQTENYLTYQEQGLTIFSFDNKAAWVNGGLLYSVEGNAQLSSEQILRLATSL